MIINGIVKKATIRQNSAQQKLALPRFYSVHTLYKNALWALQYFQPVIVVQHLTKPYSLTLLLHQITAIFRVRTQFSEEENKSRTRAGLHMSVTWYASFRNAANTFSPVRALVSKKSNVSSFSAN